MSAGAVQDSNALFTSGGLRTEATTNLINGSTLPSDQSHVTLALRVFTWFRNPILRVAGAGAGEVAQNGDYNLLAPFQVGGIAVGNAPGNTKDVYRLAWQSSEQLHWTFGTGLKASIDNMPTWYFPTGGGLRSDLAGSTDLVHLNNGMPTHEAILRLGRAVLVPPRQNILCTAKIFSLPDAGNALTFGTTQGSRNMLSLRDNLNAIDLVQKCITFCLDGLFSRDVQ
jgi:hypothetical protein